MSTFAWPSGEPITLSAVRRAYKQSESGAVKILVTHDQARNEVAQLPGVISWRELLSSPPEGLAFVVERASFYVEIQR